MTTATPKRTVFYDGLCQLCSREIGLFQKRVTDGSLAFVDISPPSFDAVSFGVDPVQVNRNMHVRDEESGRMLIGVETLVGMWECVPGFRLLAKFTRLPGIWQFSKIGYAVFAWIRPKLPKRKPFACETDRCSTR